MRGILIISLDFELFWGVRDVVPLERYRENLLGVRQAIPAILRTFEEFGVHATWATVGFLFFDSKAELCAHVPEKLPRYDDARLSPYPTVSSLGETESVDPFHFGRSLLECIRSTPGQEIGTHTFSHYYALERGQNAETFRNDLLCAVRTGCEFGTQLRSLVFPRNQVNVSYLGICRELGITAYRGNERSWIYRERRGEDDSLPRRGARLLDSYLNLSGQHTYRLSDVARCGVPFNLPASRFLRPWSSRLHPLEERRLHRIEDAMTHAARTGEAFHLWWHPHNFGANLHQNMANLTRILTHYRILNKTYGMTSASMGEVASSLIVANGSYIAGAA